MIISRTPLRISFAGGGTDLPSFYTKHGYGAVLSCSINKYIYVTVKKHSKIFKEKIRLNYSDTETVNTIDEIKNPILRECLRFMNIDDHIYISTIADVQASTGLGSSSTFCVGLLHALYSYKNESVSRGKLAEEAAHIELDVLKRPMGKQDHYSAAFGGMNYIRFNDDDSTSITPVSSKYDVAENIFSKMILFWTCIVRNSEDILYQQDKNNDKNSVILLKMREQSLEMFNLIKNGDLCIEVLGNLIHKGWKMKSKLAPNISNSNIHEAYEAALSSGALGGKILGAGGGGFLNVIVPESRKNIVIAKMLKIGLKQFKVAPDSSGTTITSIA
jgi:D-glycero-alpha-D-manno-heptose-7-phosphate kinase